jgi:hypothetical protein
MLIAALGHHKYGYYMLLRWVVCWVSSYSAARAYQAKRTGWVWMFLAIAIVFNPLLPVHLERNAWGLLDVAVAAVFLTSLLTIDRQLPRQ